MNEPSCSRGPRVSGNREGFALVLAILVCMVVAGLAMAAASLDATARVLGNYAVRQETMEAAALAGIEQGLARINGDPSLYPDSSYSTLENDAFVTDAAGDTVPAVRRWTYAGPTGVTSGQYGIFGTIVSITRSGAGAVVRRGQIHQESFAKYAYFTHVEPVNISFGGGDQIFGPVHTNDVLKIYSSGATFHGPVTTAKTVSGEDYGDFRQGYLEKRAVIPMPTTADLDRLETQAATGGTAFEGDEGGGYGEATTRIEFIAIDLDGDGQATGDAEGFFRVYQADDADWVTADVPGSGLTRSENCGRYVNGTFVSANAIRLAQGTSAAVAALKSSERRCHLGGADSLSNGFDASNSDGAWLERDWEIAALAGRADSAYLFPLSRTHNPSFKGVIHVEGNVAVSGTVRGRVTIAATGDIVIADDLVYSMDPGAGICHDIVGLFSALDIVIANNTLNAATRPANNESYFSYDDTRSEFLHAVVLALDNFAVEGHDEGSTSAEDCEDTNWGRGCLYLTGGVIQRTRGAVGTTAGTGYLKRYSYDQCAASNPPPYFPTTGIFVRGIVNEQDPAGFDVAAFYRMLTPPEN